MYATVLQSCRPTHWNDCCCQVYTQAIVPNREIRALARHCVDQKAIRCHTWPDPLCYHVPDARNQGCCFASASSRKDRNGAIQWGIHSSYNTRGDLMHVKKSSLNLISCDIFEHATQSKTITPESLETQGWYANVAILPHWDTFRDISPFCSQFSDVIDLFNSACAILRESTGS